MDWRNRKIAAAAIMKRGMIFTLPPPARHHTILAVLNEEFDILQDGSTEQGFITDHGEFVRRKPALMIAQHAGQLKRSQEPGSYQGPELFSEDLW